MSEQLHKLRTLSRSCFDISLPSGDSRSGMVKGRYLKCLLDGGCSFDCAYCPVCRNESPAAFSPDELASLVLTLWREQMIDGLFLSTGIPRETDESMEKLLRTGELLRQGGFTGYLHLKIVPGAVRSDITEAARIADRISINLEATGSGRLSEIASVKTYESDLLRRHAWIADEAPGRHTTQIVVGAAGEGDDEILSFMTSEYRKYQPARIYYSGFTPLDNTPLQRGEGADPARVKGLYAIDALVRSYGYSEEEIIPALGEDGMLLPGDPKINCSGKRRIDPSSATWEELIRIPGIGPKAADRVISLRSSGRVATEQMLREAGVVMKRAGAYLVVGGRVQGQLG
ncbi:putative DNA-binding helix-hairpin-helix protein [Methanocalculus alkaliphilus]|uniref:radical SAM protein n=1 Tax=Methanocalculus alkaliphilus TaxID=768730 RepID=UPI00209FF0F1|nr:radical SAM protein [Methanocalculus alkaliphilus]MCP1714508.1 putative DNA-binding helix-hairpin-helix protein [Methanocalculus alkaliphilus]